MPVHGAASEGSRLEVEADVDPFASSGATALSLGQLTVGHRRFQILAERCPRSRFAATFGIAAPRLPRGEHRIDGCLGADLEVDALRKERLDRRAETVQLLGGLLRAHRLDE